MAAKMNAVCNMLMEFLIVSEWATFRLKYLIIYDLRFARVFLFRYGWICVVLFWDGMKSSCPLAVLKTNTNSYKLPLS